MSTDITAKLDRAHAEVSDRVAGILDIIAGHDYVEASKAADAVMNDYLIRDEIPYSWQPGLFPALQFLKVYSMAQAPVEGFEADQKRTADALSVVKDELSRFTIGDWAHGDRHVNGDLIIALHAGLATQLGRSGPVLTQPIFEGLADMVALNQPRQRDTQLSGRDQMYFARSEFYKVCEEFLGSGVSTTIAKAGFDGINTTLSTHRDRLLTSVADFTYKMPSTEHSRKIADFLD